MTQLRVLIIAGDPLARAGLTALLAAEPRLTVVGQLAPGADLVTQAQAYQPEVALWDLGWNSAANLDTLADFTEVGPPVLALVTDEEGIGEIWAAGVRGLLLREASDEHLTAALWAVAQGLVTLEPTLAADLVTHAHPRATLPPVEPLSPRELEVLHGLADGLANKEIARNLGISEHTVKFHVNAILGKLGAQSRTDAVVRATRAGVILL